MLSRREQKISHSRSPPRCHVGNVEASQQLLLTASSRGNGQCGAPCPALGWAPAKQQPQQKRWRHGAESPLTAEWPTSSAAFGPAASQAAPDDNTSSGSICVSETDRSCCPVVGRPVVADDVSPLAAGAPAGAIASNDVTGVADARREHVTCGPDIWKCCWDSDNHICRNLARRSMW